jgi:hypothetical protein
MKIDNDFIEKIRMERELHRTVANLATVAAAVAALQRDVDDFKRHIGAKTKE